MTRIERPRDETDAFAGDLAADSRERAVGALLKIPPLRKLWSAQLTGGIADRLGMLVLIWLTVQAAVLHGSFGGGYRGASFAVAAVLGVRLVSTLLFGAVLLGPLTALTATAGALDRRWTMIGADGVRLALFIVAPLWIAWVPSSAVVWLLVTAFVAGIAERLWTVAKDGAAPGLLPAPTPGDTAVRPAPDHLTTLRRLDLRTGFVALPLAAAALLVVTLLNSLLALGVRWFDLHQVALSSYVAAGLFSSSVAVLYFLELPDSTTVRPHSPLEGLRLPKGPDGSERGRTGALPLLVLATAGVAGSIAAAVSLAVLHALDLGFGPVGYGLLVLALTAGTVLGIRMGPRILPTLSRRRLLAIAIAVTGLALLLTGLVPDQTTVLLLAGLAGTAAGVTANTGHVLVEQEAEEQRRARTTDHLHAVVRVAVAVAAIGAPVLAGLIGPHRLANGHFTFQHGGAAYTLMLIGALLLPVAALVLGKTDDRQGVPLRRDLREALRGGEPAAAPHPTGFFIAIEGGDGAGKSTQVEALSEWIRAKGHEVVVTREPGATAVGKRLRSILLDVSSAGLSHRAEALLYAADRAEHVDSVVRPALERGAVVVSDRYIDSSVAYQGAGRDLAPTEIARISRWATAGLVPNLTVLLDVAPEAARERFTEAPDRLESEPAAFHQRVRAGFLTLAAADPSRYLVIDAAQEPEAVTTVVRHRLDQALPLSQQEIEAREEARRQAVEAARIRAEEEAARIAEEARLEAERQAQLARLREEEAERQREIEEAARREAAEQEAEAARLRAEEAARLAEEERLRLAAEEAARAAEQDRLRRQAEEESKLRAEAEARRLEKQRKAEDALRRAEQARAAAAAAAAAATAAASSTTQTLQTPKPAPRTPDAETTVLPVPQPPASAADETAVLPSVPAPAADETAVLPPVRSAAADETAVLPPVRPAAAAAERKTAARPPAAQRAADETAVLPSVRPEAADRGPAGRTPAERDRTPAERPADRPADRDRTPANRTPADRGPVDGSPADRVPPSFFRPETPDNERTRELPAVDPDAAPPARRPRSDWAEETPLDHLPTLADELLGSHNDEDEGPKGPKKRR